MGVLYDADNNGGETEVISVAMTATSVTPTNTPLFANTGLRQPNLVAVVAA